MQLGTDIIEIDRIVEVRGRQAKFPERILTDLELDIFNNYSEVRQGSFLAGRFSAKEAYGKAIGTGVGSRLRFTDITILPDERGVPVITKGPFVHPEAKVSISHSRFHATATVIINIDDEELRERLKTYFAQRNDKE
ncbi:holo-ACP synthase [Aerococcaceae bacterium WGS1372]